MERHVGSHLLGSFANCQSALPENQVGGRKSTGCPKGGGRGTWCVGVFCPPTSVMGIAKGLWEFVGLPAAMLVAGVPKWGGTTIWVWGGENWSAFGVTGTDLGMETAAACCPKSCASKSAILRSLMATSSKASPLSLLNWDSISDLNLLSCSVMYCCARCCNSCSLLPTACWALCKVCWTTSLALSWVLVTSAWASWCRWAASKLSWFIWASCNCSLCWATPTTCWANCWASKDSLW